MKEKNLEYKIGGIDIQENFCDFIVEAENERTVAIYVCFGPGHENVAKNFGLNPYSYQGYDYMASLRNENETLKPDKVGRIVGGGRCRLYENKIVLDGQSGNYGPIPKYVAGRFLELLMPTLQTLGDFKRLGIINTSAVFTIADPIEIPTEKYSPFWRQE